MKAIALFILLSTLVLPNIGSNIEHPTQKTVAVLDAGGLDPTFGTGGKVRTDIQGDFDKARGVAIQADGKIVVAGSAFNGTNIDFAVLRYNADGTLDTSFDGDGKVITPVLNSDDFATSVAIQPDGKIVAAGFSDVGGTDDVAVVRYNADGSLDTTFDTDGKDTFDIVPGQSDFANAVAVQPDGKIVVAGFSFNGADDDFTVIRLNDDGSLDTSFNVIGVSTFAILERDDVANAVAIQPDGKIVLAGYTDNGHDIDFAAARLNPNGAFDPSFNGNGKVASGVQVGDDIGTSAAIQADDRIVVAGYSRDAGPDTDFAAIRYNTNGSLDLTFDTDGKVTVRVASPNDVARSVALEPDGKIVIAGETDNGSNLDFGVVRLHTDGSLDPTFDLDGKAIIDFQNSSDTAFGAAIQTDGKIVVVGDSDINTVHDIGLVRLEGTLGTGGQIRYVATTGSDAANDCLLIGSPCATIAHAISVANAGDTISIAAGTYTELGLIVDKSLTFTGAGAATTIVQANALPGVAADRVFAIIGGLTVSMSNFTIKNGKAPTGTTGSDCTSLPCLPGSNGGQGQAGGGILNDGTLTFTNMVLSGNRAGKGGTAGNISCPVGACNNIGGEGGTGGGVYSTGSLTVASSTFTNNHAGEPGDAASTVGCGSCTSNPGDTGNGGGLAGKTISVNSSLFTGNSGDDGGGILQGDAAITITNTTFTENSASNTGGAINCNGVVLGCTISGSAIYDNFTSGTQGGTVALFGLSVKNISNTTITGNDSLGDAGGILANAGTVNITFVTISDNIADANNSSTGDGGGIRNEVATVNLKNSIVADNSDDGGEAPQISGVITSLGYNHVESTTGGTFAPSTGDVIGSEDGLAPLANNGGPTQTQGLYASSQAIDQIPNGTNGCGIAPFDVDQRGSGFPRPVNGACDKGAFEGTLGTAPQEIDVTGLSVSIPDLDTTPSTADDTDFGSTSPTGGTVVHTFTIHNSGTGSLTVSNPIINGTNPLDFAVTASPISPVPPGGTTTFQVTFDPIVAGLRTATVNIINNDLNENPYDFAIQGTGGKVETTIQFNSSVYSGPESMTATVTVTRTGDTSGTSTVQYATSNGTATGGAACSVIGRDYVSTSGTLTFSATETSKTFPVALCSDYFSESPAETLNATLSNATGGTLGTQATATVRIDDAAAEFTNNTQINITDGLPGTPYPSTINVSGYSGAVLGMRLTLFNVTHPRPQDLSVLLVDPSGTRSLVVMQDVGGLAQMNGTTITLEDAAASFMPMSSPIAPGQNYRPTNCLSGAGFFPPPAPQLSYGNPGCTGSPPGDTFASQFSGFNPNGDWSLYTVDALDPDMSPKPLGSASFIGGWGIQFLLPTAAPASISGRLLTASGEGIRNAAVTITGGGLDHPITTYTGTFGYYSFGDLQTGTTYIVSVRPKRFVIANPVRAVTLTDNVVDVDFVAEPQ